MAEQVHRHGARIFVQLHHGGQEAPPALNGGKLPMGRPSAILNKVNRLASTEMTKEEISYILSLLYTQKHVHIYESIRV